MFQQLSSHRRPKGRLLTKNWLTKLWLIGSFFSVSTAVFAQETAAPKPQNVQLSGSLTAFTEGYAQTGLLTARRPASQTGLNGTLNVRLFDKVDLPFSFFTSTAASSNIALPFNQFGVSPTIGKTLTLHAGYFSTKLSDFTLSDIQILGGGVEWSPKFGRLAVISGVSQRAVAPSVQQVGLFRRRIDAAQIGAGNAEGFHIWFTALRGRDDTSSLATNIRRTEGVIAPIENLAGAVELGFKIRKSIRFSTEIAASAFSANTLADTVDLRQFNENLGTVQDNFRANASTKVDAAGSAKLDLTFSRRFSMRLEGRYVGPGYQSAGALFLENDVIDMTIAPRLKYDKWNISAKIGRRQNNLNESRLTTTTRNIYNLNFNWEASEVFSLSANYANFGLQGAARTDTFRIANVSQTFSLSPTVTILRGSNANTFAADYSYQDYTDRNIVSGSTGNARHHSASLNHILTLGTSGLSFSTMGLFITGTVDDIETQLFTLSETIGKSFFKNKLSLNLTAAYNTIATTETDKGTTFNFRAAYRLTKMLRLELSAQNRQMNYKNTARKDFKETLVRAGFGFNF